MKTETQKHLEYTINSIKQQLSMTNGSIEACLRTIKKEEKELAEYKERKAEYEIALVEMKELLNNQPKVSVDKDDEKAIYQIATKIFEQSPTINGIIISKEDLNTSQKKKEFLSKL